MTFRNTKTKKSTTKKYRCVVKAENKKPDESKAAKITAIKQEKASSLAATFSADVTGVTYGAISVVRDETKAVVTVKSITVDKKDNTKAVIETYEALTDGKAYTVTYKAADGTESSAAFTATSGTVTDIALNSYSIPANTPTEIKYQTLDANGVIIEEAGIGSSASNKMEITIENANGYQKDNDLLLYKTGDTATVKVVYHTFKYNNTNGTEEGKVEKSFTITAVDQSTVIETFDYSVTDGIDAAVDFKRDTLVTQVAMDDDKNGDPYAKFSFRTAADKDITKSLDYTVSSGNENLLLASGNVAGGAKLTPVGVGATYLVIKNASGNVITTLPITVVAKRSLSTMTVDKSSVTVSKLADAAGKQKITVAVMDQYSSPYTSYTVSQPERKSSNDPGNLHVNAAAPVKNKTVITIDSSDGANVGTYTYTMDLTDTVNSNNVKKVSFSVTVSELLATGSHALVMMNGARDTVISKVDTTVTTDDFSATTLYPTIVVKNNGSITGVAADVVSIGGLRLTKNGTDVSNTKGIYAGTGADNTTGAALVHVTSGDGATGTPVVKYLDPGTYTISFTARFNDGSSQNMATSFIVEDSQKVFEASVKKEAVTKSGYTTLAQVFEDTDYVTFNYASRTLDKAEYPYSYVDADSTNVNSNSVRVNKVTMKVKLPGTNGKFVQMTANVNRTFTFAGGVVTKANVQNAINSFKTSYANGTALKSGLSTTQLEAAVSKALEIKNQSASDSLTADEKAALAADAAVVETLGKAAAVEIVKDLATKGSALSLNTLEILGISGVNASDFTEVYKPAMIAASVTLASSATDADAAKTALEAIITTESAKIAARKEADASAASDLAGAETALKGVTNALTASYTPASGSSILVTATAISATCDAVTVTDIEKVSTSNTIGVQKKSSASGHAWVANDTFVVEYQIAASKTGVTGDPSYVATTLVTTIRICYTTSDTGTTWTAAVVNP